MEFDTVTEALEYKKAIGSISNGATSSPTFGNSGTWAVLLHELRAERYAHQRRILALVKSAGRIERTELARELGMNNQAVGGAMAGLTKACKRAGLPDVRPVLLLEGSAYLPGPLLEENRVPKEYGR